MEKQPQEFETCIKDGFEEMEHKSLFGTLQQGKQNELFTHSVAPGNFPWKRREKFLFHLLSNRIFWKLFVNGKKPVALCYNFMGSKVSMYQQHGQIQKFMEYTQKCTPNLGGNMTVG